MHIPGNSCMKISKWLYRETLVERENLANFKLQKTTSLFVLKRAKKNNDINHEQTPLIYTHTNLNLTQDMTRNTAKTIRFQILLELYN